MHHICTICESPFLLDSDSATVDTETVVTTCGHIFHRDCIQLRAGAEGATCRLCSASLREGNKFTKIFLFYDEDEDDGVELLKEVQRGTAADKFALDEQLCFFGLEREEEDLSEARLFNQQHTNLLVQHAEVLDSHVDEYQKRLKRLQLKINEVEAQCRKLEAQL